MNDTRGNRQIAVILSGGGAKGAYQVGVLKALQARKIEPRIYCGISMGAFNAAMVVSGLPLEKVEEIWTNLTQDDIFHWRYDPSQLLTMDPRVPMNWVLQSVQSLLDFSEATLRSGGGFLQAVDLDALMFDTTSLKQLIRKHVDIRAIRHSDKQQRIALTCLTGASRGAVRVIDNHAVEHEHIYASCSIPLIFPSVTIGGEVYCDGGPVINSPLKLALEHDAGEIYVTYLPPPPRQYVNATLPMAYQVMSASFASAVSADLGAVRSRNAEFLAAFKQDRLVDGRFQVARLQADGTLKTKEFQYVRLYEICPVADTRGLRGLLDFSPESARRLIDQGRADTEQMLDSYQEGELRSAAGAVIRIPQQL